MTTENRRKEEYEAKTEDSGNPIPPTNSAMVDKAKKEESILPDNQRYIHIPQIEGVVNDYNMQEAMGYIPMMTLVCVRS